MKLIGQLTAVLLVLAGSCGAASAQVAGPPNFDSGLEELSYTAVDGPAETGRYCPGCGYADCCCTRCGFEAAVEGTFLQPDVGRGFFTLGSADYDFEPAPRFWVGSTFENDWGWRVRYWDFDAEADASESSLEPDLAISLSGDEFLSALAVDVEVTRRLRLERWCLTGSLGVRSAEIERSDVFNIRLVDLVSDTATVSITDVLRSFEGTGVTFAAEGRRPLGASRVAAILNARGSVLWGSNRAAINAEQFQFAPDGLGNIVLINQQTAAADGEEDDTLWIGEFQAGLEWSQPLDSFGDSILFIRGAFELQGWSYGGIVLPAPFGQTQDETVDFIGGTVTVGFMR
ncbi:MAG: hypothetical protein L0211_08850 [Planctomycetaceae bacterium]|nr:hypothetical protein [Planctomycetaceae bacterium]